jgi:hypothetical protein
MSSQWRCGKGSEPACLFTRPAVPATLLARADEVPVFRGNHSLCCSISEPVLLDLGACAARSRPAVCLPLFAPTPLSRLICGDLRGCPRLLEIADTANTQQRSGMVSSKSRRRSSRGFRRDREATGGLDLLPAIVATVIVGVWLALPRPKARWIALRRPSS